MTIVWEVHLTKPAKHGFDTKKVKIVAATGALAEELAAEEYGYGWKVVTRLTTKIAGSYET